MNDMRGTIIPKSDQLNADDLLGGRTMTITVTGVDITMNEQPVAIHFEGDEGKPYRPGKSMRRVLVNVWGPDANVYVGRSMTLYRDDHVKFGGLDVGGIRISHMSHMNGEITMALTATRAIRKPFTVKPLATPKPPLLSAPEHPLDEPDGTIWMVNFGDLLGKAITESEVVDVAGHPSVLKALDKAPARIKKQLNDMIHDAYDRVRQADDGSSASEDPLDALVDHGKFPA